MANLHEVLTILGSIIAFLTGIVTYVTSHIAVLKHLEFRRKYGKLTKSQKQAKKFEIETARKKELIAHLTKELQTPNKSQSV